MVNNLNETTKTSKKNKRVFFFIFSLLLFITGLLITGMAVENNLDYNKTYSSNVKNEIIQQIEIAKEKLLTRKSELESKGIKYNKMAQPDDGDAYELCIIVDVLEDHNSMSAFFAAKKFPNVANYYNLMGKLESIENNSVKIPLLLKFIIFYLIGGFQLIAAIAYFLIMLEIPKKPKKLAKIPSTNNQENIVINPNIDNPNIDNPNIDYLNLDNLNIEKTNIDDLNSDNLNTDDFNLDAPNMENLNISNPNIDYLNLDNLNIEKTNIDDLNSDNLNTDDLNLDTTNIENLNISNPNIDYLNLDNLNIEKTNIDDFNIDSLNTEDLNTEALKNGSKKCIYCGSDVNENDSECNSCGGKLL